MLVEDIDAQGKISLKPVGPEWEVPEGTDPNGGGGRPREDRGGRGGGERGGRGGERSGVPSGSGGGGGDKPRGRRFRDQPGSERTDTPPAE